MQTTIKKIFSTLLAAALMLGLFTFTPILALADASGASGPVGLPGTIAIGGDNNDGSTASGSPTEVGFNGKRWQVIGYDGMGVASAANHMTLLLKNGESYGTASFNSANDYVNYSYYDSTYGELYLKMEDIYNTSPLGEKALIQARDIDAKDNALGTETVPNRLFWPLSILEAQSVNDAVLIFSDDWWLRSPGSNDDFRAAYVGGGGDKDPFGNDVIHAFAVRPAFNLNLSSVLFTSDASAAGAAGVSELATYTAPTGALKFTALDTAFSSGFAIAEAAVSGAPGAAVTLNYTGAAAGANNFIHVKLMNNAAPGQIAYAAVPVSNITAAGGSFSLTLPADMPMGAYTAYVWAEEGNGANFTNRTSTPETFALAVQPSVTFSPSPGSINLNNPTNIVFQADAPAPLSGYTFEGVAFQNVTAGTSFGRPLDSGDGVTYNPATGALTVPAAAFGQHASIGGGNRLTPGTYRARILFWNGASLYLDYYADFEITDAALSSSKGITAFSINGVNGTIDEAVRTIAVTLPYGTDVTNLAPSITHTGASVSPANGAKQNFASPVIYTVTAQDGSTKDYQVTVTVNGVSHSVSATINKSTLPQTDDNTNLLPWELMIAAGLCVAGAMLLYRKKRKHMNQA